MGKLLFSLLLLALSTTAVSAQQFDVVLEGGRVMDPETGLDAVRNIGIRDGKIARISSEGLSARRVVRAAGLIVAPGFIDLHQHGQDIASQRVKALDGVTTALELEIGAPDVAQFLNTKDGHSLIHYGASASHAPAAWQSGWAFSTPRVQRGWR
jgi:N-acyl-D-aspartate/D-glutamate deacylase